MKYEPQNADVHVLLGYVRVEQGRLDEAIEVLRRARDLGATSRWLDYNWGLAHERRFEDRQAADRFQRAVDYRLEGQLDRNRFAVIASYRRLILALIRLRDFDRADQVFRQRLNALADVEEAALGLCEDWYLQFRLQHFGDLHFVQQAIDTMREHECFVRANLVAMAQLLKSGVLSRQGEGEEAAQWLDRARFSIEYPGEFLYLVAQGQATSASLGAIRRELLSLDPQTQADEAAVRMAVAERDAFALAQLIKSGVPADRPIDPVGATALMLAAWSGDVSLAKALVAAGASISDRDLSGRTALDYARAAGSSSMVKFLSGLAQGA